jgi:uncharacterized protein (UPF0548 family)
MGSKKQASKGLLALLGIAVVGAGAAATYWWWRNERTDTQFVKIDVVKMEDIEKPILPDNLYNDSAVQHITDGTGALFHRRYSVDILNPMLSAEQLMDAIKSDLNNFTPKLMAYFEKTKGDPDRFAMGDEYFIHITGPWNGPVRTVDISPTSFSFLTLEGHLEAGQIHFQVIPHPTIDGALRFRILSWARSADRLVEFAYDFAEVVQNAQGNMWRDFCRQVVDASGGEQLGRLQVITQRTPFEGEKVGEVLEQVPTWYGYRNRIQTYQNTDYNFDINAHESFTAANGWRIDSYVQELPSESPGEPAPQGSFETARQIIRNYEFPDPNLITGIFVPDSPLENRVMVLRARFLFFTFFFGVKVGSVIDEIRQDPEKGQARVWGWSYRTLEGHFEMGEITFSLWKFLDTGEVQFRINAYSKVTAIPNIFYRIGFRLFGRGLQVRFARTAMARVDQLVRERAVHIPDEQKREPIPESAEKVEVKPISSDEQAAQTSTAAEEIDSKAAAKEEAAKLYGTTPEEAQAIRQEGENLPDESTEKPDIPTA